MFKRNTYRVLILILCVATLAGVVAAKQNTIDVIWLNEGLIPFKYYASTETLFVESEDGLGVIKPFTGETLVACGTEAWLDGAEFSIFLSEEYGDEREDIMTEDPLPFSNANGIGFINSMGEIIVTPDEFCMYASYSEGRALVCKRDGNDFKYGFVDDSGNIIVPPEYDSASIYSEGMAAVCKDGKVGFVDLSGELVIPLQYDWAEKYLILYSDYFRFSDGFASVGVEYEGGVVKYGFIDKNGNMVIEPQFDETRFFSEGLAAVFNRDTNGDWCCGFIDRNGDYAIPMELSASTGKFHFSSESNSNCYYFCDGCAWVESEVIDGNSKEWKLGLINKSGELIAPYQYSRVESFSEGIAAACKESADWKWGYIDSNGNEICDFKYDWVYPFSDGMARVSCSHYDELGYGSPSCSYIDITGKEAIPEQYAEEATDFIDGTAIIENLDGISIIDHTGEKLITLDNSILFEGAIGGEYYSVCTYTDTYDIRYGIFKVPNSLQDKEPKTKVFGLANNKSTKKENVESENPQTESATSPWRIIGFLLAVGTIGYLLYRKHFRGSAMPEQPKEVLPKTLETNTDFCCEECGNKLDTDNIFCPNCGAKVNEQLLQPDAMESEKPQVRFCENCGKQLQEDMAFCPDCGTPPHRLRKEVSTS